MILVLGANTYIGHAFATELRRRGVAFIPLTREAFDFGHFEFFFDYVRHTQPEFVINAAEMVAAPGADIPHSHRTEAVDTNTVLPQTVGRVCLLTNTPWAQVSSGNIYSGAKLMEGGRVELVPDLTRPEILKLHAARPGQFLGFTEWDEPNFSFRTAATSFYSGTKALAEEALGGQDLTYIWRFRLPFNEQDQPANFVSQLLNGLHHQDAINSLSHLDECVRACLDLVKRHAPYGIYNVVNPGAIRTRDVVRLIRACVKCGHVLDGWNGQEQPRLCDPPPARPHCVLDAGKVVRAGVKLRHIREALTEALVRWKPQPSRVVTPLNAEELMVEG